MDWTKTLDETLNERKQHILAEMREIKQQSPDMRGGRVFLFSATGVHGTLYRVEHRYRSWPLLTMESSAPWYEPAHERRDHWWVCLFRPVTDERRRNTEDEQRLEFRWPDALIAWWMLDGPHWNEEQCAAFLRWWAWQEAARDLWEREQYELGNPVPLPLRHPA